MKASPGSLWQNRAARWHFRVRLGKRHAFPLPAGVGDEDARKREALLSGLVTDLRAAGRAEGAADYLRDVAAAPDREALRKALAEAGRYLSGKLAPRLTKDTATIAHVAEELLSGRLAEAYPDHVRPWRQADPRRSYLRLHVLPAVGHARVAAFALEDALAFLAGLSPRLSSATRSEIAGTLDLLVSLAVFPMRLRETSPLPRKWKPRPAPSPARPFLYPAEEARLVGCQDVPLVPRVFYAFMAREGVRSVEARAMRWSDLDLARGTVRLDVNKTNDPRTWVLGEDVVRALLAWKNVLARTLGRPVVGSDHVFTYDGTQNGRQNVTKFRTFLRRAGVDRPELFTKTKARGRVRIHDLRAGFVTLALATGKTETWVADRTGHRSSDMINAYRRQARMAEELRLGWYAPMDEAIPELAGEAVTGNAVGMRRRA